MPTTTFYPSLDGLTEYFNSAGVSWDTIHDASSSTSASDIADIVIGISSDITSNEWENLGRATILFDTSSLGTDAVVDSATLSFSGYAKSNTFTATDFGLNIVSASPASDSTLVVGDYDQYGTTVFSTAISYSSFSTTGYNNFALNASGIANISIAGISKFGLRESTYDIPDSSPAHEANKDVAFFMWSSEQSGTSLDPKLVVTYHIEEVVSGSASGDATASGSANASKSASTASASGDSESSGSFSGVGRIESNASRKIVQSTQISWNKSLVSSYRLFTIGVSAIGGGDFINSEGAVNSDWNKYLYSNESAYVTMLDYERALKMPLGGLVKAIGDASLDNTSGRFTPRVMGGTSELFTAVSKPGRPIIINAGFNYDGVDQMNPQFVGVTTKSPEIDMRSRSVQLHFADFINFLQNRYVDDTTMYTGIRTDTLIENFLVRMGYGTSQYDLDIGINTIPFLIAEVGAKFSDIIDRAVQAENGHIYQDELGIIRFENRQHWDSPPYTYETRVLTTSMVMDATAPSDDHIINVVEVRSSPREKQPSGNIYTLNVPIELATGDNEIFINFENPVLAADAPVVTANSLEDGSGSDISGSVARKNTSLFAQAVKYTFTNNSGGIGYITALTINGREATVGENIYWRQQDDSSVTAYEERPIIVENDYIQDLSWAKSYAQLILNDFSEPEKLQTVKIRAISAFKLGDLISWQGRSWRIFGIKTEIDPSVGFVQELQLLQREIIRYFRIGISTIGGADSVAP